MMENVLLLKQFAFSCRNILAKKIWNKSNAKFFCNSSQKNVDTSKNQVQSIPKFNSNDKVQNLNLQTKLPKVDNLQFYEENQNNSQQIESSAEKEDNPEYITAVAEGFNPDIGYDANNPDTPENPYSPVRSFP